MFQKENALTLIELLIVLIIVAILAASAISMYRGHTFRARRVDAIQTLLSMQLAQENYRSNNSQYGTLAQIWNNVSSTTNGYYSLSISNVSATGYTLTATANSTQASDSENGTTCSPLILAVSNGTETKAPAACWLNN